MLDQISPALSGLGGIIILVGFIFIISKLLQNRSDHNSLAGSHQDHKTSKMGKLLKTAAKWSWNKYKKTKEEKKNLLNVAKQSIEYAKNEKSHGMKGSALMDKLAAKEDKSSIDSISIAQSLEGMQGRAIDMFSSLALLIQSLAYSDKNETIIESQEHDEQKALFEFTSQLNQLAQQSVGKKDLEKIAIKQIDSYFEQLKAHFIEYADSYLVHSEDVMVHNLQFMKHNGLDELRKVIREAKHGEAMFKKEIKIEGRDLSRERKLIGDAVKKKQKEITLNKHKLTTPQKFQLETQVKLLTQQGNVLREIEKYMVKAHTKIKHHQSELDNSISQIKSEDSKLEHAFNSFETEYKKLLTKQLELRKEIHHLSKEEHEIKTQQSIEGAISVIAQALESVRKKHDTMIQEEAINSFSKLKQFIQVAHETAKIIYQFEARLQTMEQIESALIQAHEKMDVNIAKIESDDLSSIENDAIQTLQETKHLLDDDTQIANQMRLAQNYIEEQLSQLDSHFELHKQELEKINQVYNQGISNINVLATQAMKQTTRWYQDQNNQMSSI